MTPLYKSDLSNLEIARLQVSFSCNQEVEHIFVVPKGLDITDICRKFPNSFVKEVDPWYLRSKNNYNLLLLNEEFYKLFIGHDFITILQTDAFLLKNVLELYELNFDYIGPSFYPTLAMRKSVFGKKMKYENWRNRYSLFYKEVLLEVGNGGLSIRKIPSVLYVIDKMKSSKLSNQIFKTQNRLFAEDVAFSFFMKELNLRLPSKQRADTIFCDSIPLRNIKMSEVFGFHGLEKREPDLERIILELFQNQKI